jgi:hypothetical protein
VDVLRQTCAVRQRELVLVVGEHRVGKSGGYGDEHPVHDSRQELAAIAFNESLDNGTIHGGDLEADESAQDEEEAVADDEAGFPAGPAGDDDAQQAQQGTKKVAVQLDLLFGGAWLLIREGAGPRSGLLSAKASLADGGGLLVGNAGADAVREGNEEGDVDAAGDARAILQVHGRQLRDESFDVARLGSGAPGRGRLGQRRRHDRRRGRAGAGRRRAQASRIGEDCVMESKQRS